MAFSADDPIYVVYTPTAQCLACLGCLEAFHPPQLLPMMLFVLVGKEFVRAHRFCKPRHDFRGLLGAIQRNENILASVREPGQDG